MKSIFAFSILVLALFNGSFAQTNEPLPCPTISLVDPERANSEGYISYSVNFDGDQDKYTPQYEWTVKNGEIVSGQGTSTVRVKMSSGLLIITVNVKFPPQNCLKSITTSLTTEYNVLILIDEFSIPVSRINKAGIENIAVALKNDSTATAYIIEKFEWKTSKNATKLKIRKLKSYLFETLKIEKNRVKILMANADKISTQFFIAPAGAIPPNCDDCVLAEFE